MTTSADAVSENVALYGKSLIDATSENNALNGKSLTDAMSENDALYGKSLADEPPTKEFTSNASPDKSVDDYMLADMTEKRLRVSSSEPVQPDYDLLLWKESRESTPGGNETDDVFGNDIAAETVSTVSTTTVDDETNDDISMIDGDYSRATGINHPYQATDSASYNQASLSFAHSDIELESHAAEGLSDVESYTVARYDELPNSQEPISTEVSSTDGSDSVGYSRAELFDDGVDVVAAAMNNEHDTGNSNDSLESDESSSSDAVSSADYCRVTYRTSEQ